MDFSSSATRPLTIQIQSNRVSIPVEIACDRWAAAEYLKETFLYDKIQKNDPTFSEGSMESSLLLMVRFAEHILENLQDCKARLAVLRSVIHAISAQYLSEDIHTVTASFEPVTRLSILGSYYRSFVALEQAGEDLPHSLPSSLFQASASGNASIYALFGGQGTNEVYFDELRALYRAYKPFVASFLTEIGHEVLAPLSSSPSIHRHTYYAHGIDVVGWLEGSSEPPPVDYLASIPISFPLIGLTQLVQYLASCRILGYSPGQMRNHLAGATGHSQGIVSAVVASASSSFEDFVENSKRAVKWLFYSGLRGQEAFPTLDVSPDIIKDSLEGGEGAPSPMLSVTGLLAEELKFHINKTNQHLSENSKLQISLYNGPRAFVVTGPPKGLYGLVVNLRNFRAAPGLDQSKVPFSRRKAVFSIRFLVVGVPYHHGAFLSEAVNKVCEVDLQGAELFSKDIMTIPVFNTEDGTDIRACGGSLTRLLCQQIFTSPIHWMKATDFPKLATHAIDFGPGGLSGIGPLTARNLEGRGLRVVVVGEKGPGGAEIYTNRGVKYDQRWVDKFAPRLVKLRDGKITLDTPFSRLLGKAPLMVAGMTPTTVKAGFVSAVLRAGYHVELAGGGHYNASALRAKVAEIQKQIPDGVGLTLNSLYINPKQFGFQLPLWQEMRREGAPIEGFCVAAGIPSIEKATEILNSLRESGIKHVSFKPGSLDGIRQVINIAAANPDFPIILQWTGGRAGGHHSCEDFHQPILATYGAIRQQSNICLVAGSGFGSAEDMWPYLNGSWSETSYLTQPMPFDGFLLASRVMVAKEAHTSSSVKDLIVQAPGTDDKLWEGTYTRETGGILTVRSELGEPIHKIATRAVKLWKEFDDKVFSLPREKRVIWLQDNKKQVTEKLNKDFAKPWFAEKKDGTVTGDLADMTYEDVAFRLTRLMFVQHQKRWIDASLRNLVGDWLRRVEERFVALSEANDSEIQSYQVLEDPWPFLDQFFTFYPAAKSQLIASEDKAYFLAISQRPGQKPVPFIPILDANFEVWFKKDSLWQAEDIDAVFDQDPQRVCILQGPVAAKHSKVKDEPITDLLGDIVDGLTHHVLHKYYGGKVEDIPTIDYLGGSVQASLTLKEEDEPSQSIFELSESVPSTKDWLELLSGPRASWLRALLTSQTIVQGNTFIDNPIGRIFAPRPYQRVIISRSHGQPREVKIYGNPRSDVQRTDQLLCVSSVFDAATDRISVRLFESNCDVSLPLEFLFNYKPSQASSPIHEVMEGRNRRIKEFYWKLWFPQREFVPVDLRNRFVGPEMTINASAVAQFCASVGNNAEAFQVSRSDFAVAPMDFAIVIGWEAIIQAIFPDVVDGDLLKLVHLSNSFRMLSGESPLRIGDLCKAEGRIASMVNGDSGKTVKVKGYVMRDGKPIIEVTSAFLYRGRFYDHHNSFEVVDEDDYAVELKTDADLFVLRSKDWLEWVDSVVQVTTGDTLIFRLQSEIFYKTQSTIAKIAVSGNVYLRNQLKELIRVASVDYEKVDVQSNPIKAYLDRHGTVVGLLIPLENQGYAFTGSMEGDRLSAPLTNVPYANISGDLNPIHVNPYFADYALLPDTITHGMWTSAATRKFVENAVAQGDPARVLAYNVNFVGMVVPKTALSVLLRHVGMRDGRLVIGITTKTGSGEVVLEGSAEVAQPVTAYVFTGQGSQEPGMGMELYQNSPAAQVVWDQADSHLRAVYGFSILDIVKNNPKEKVIHFGGLKGQAIRQRYMEMTYDSLDKDGVVQTLPLFADIDVRTPRYTFSHPQGLLFATQFAQIALVVTEKAAFEDMRSKGLIQRDCPFAGHSLGEYSALASIADVLPISALVDVVFYRGITMQRAVERDEYNRSNYAMCAVNPSRISPTFNDSALREVVEAIARTTHLLLEIVNFNVEGQQYVCAGELAALQTLTNVLNYLKLKKIDIAELTKSFTVDKVKQMLGEIINSAFSEAQEQKAKEGYITLERGFATIPLPGIDVPFHSRYLWAGVMPFRAYLSKKIRPESLNPDMLISKYIPNLIAEPFSVSREYVQKIFDQTSSPKLDKVLRHWDRDNWDGPLLRQKLAYTILVELLAYQFASPVRWIETQDRLFDRFKCERFIEIGPGPTLTGMATRTLKAKYESEDNSRSRKRVVLCHAKNTKEVYYHFEDTVHDSDQAKDSSPVLEVAPVPVAPVITTPSLSNAATSSLEDEQLRAITVLRTIVAQKLKKRSDEIPLSKTIKELVGGKSTLQNELLGDLQLEFSTTPEKGEELSLDELGSVLETGYPGVLGKYTSGLVSRLVSGKMPGGFGVSAIKGHLSKSWGLGSSRADAVLLLALTNEPAKRLNSEVEAKTWLDGLASTYASQAGITLLTGESSAQGGSGGVTIINSEEFIRFQNRQNQFADQQIQIHMRYLGRDSRAGERASELAKDSSLSLQSRLDEIAKEHGDAYIEGIRSVFEPLKARHFDSSWNWARQDALLMFYDIIFGRLTAVDREITARCIAIMNRADPALLRYMQFHIDRVDPDRGETYRLAKEFGQQLIDNCKEVIGQSPVYKDVTFPTAPQTEIDESGRIVYSEVNREGVRKLEAYVEEMASGDMIPGYVNIQKVQDDVTKLWNAVKSQPEITADQRNKIKALYEGVVKSLKRNPESRPRVSRSRRRSSQFLRPQIPTTNFVPDDKIPLLHLKRKIGGNWEYSSNLSSLYLDILSEIATSGTTFQDKNALLTGVGKGSIGVEILKGLLSGGAHVVITTSRYSRVTVEYYQGIYHQFGSRGSALTVVPFNQASRQDVEALVDYIYSAMGLDLDYILPFAALPENGREIDGLDDKSELAHRLMLVNVYRLMGAVKNKKASRQFVTRPTQVILPLSPNHGLFGNDGLYSESKVSLENLFARWSSESWGEYLCLAGAVIGWTRGTGLMNANNTVAQGLERYGVRTFSAKEMAFNILGLMHPLLFSITQVEPIWADLNGGMDRLPDLSEITTRIRSDLLKEADLRTALSRDNAFDFVAVNGNGAERLLQKVKVSPRGNFTYDYPCLEETKSLADLSHLRDLYDLSKIIVITGSAEVGPWGSSRTRWEMEARGEFTIEGCIEMAWIMGFIKYFDGRLKNGSLYVGWVETHTGEPVDDKDVKAKFEAEILAHAGIRLIEPELFSGYDPNKKVFNQEIQLTHDLEPLEVGEEEARKFKAEHGEKCDIWPREDGQWFVKFKEGARMFMPKAFKFNRTVAGQLPTGWHAGRFGIPEDIISQTDRVTLWALVSAAEALITSGITDPYELYQHMHPSDVGTSLGSGMGGLESLGSMFKDRRDSKEVQNDILQETFINTTAGWINLLLLSSSGPIKIPVGACATALQSLEIACDTILSGKAKVMLAGGFDDLTEEGSFEFGNMKATSNADTEFAMGREPNEFSRPTTTTRAGFMESQGAGVHVLMSAQTALELGCPIRGIIGFTSTSTDKAGRSIPAPGRGALTIARQVQSSTSNVLLDVKYRSRQLAFRRKQISEWMEHERTLLQDESQLSDLFAGDQSQLAVRLAAIEQEALNQEKQALATYGMLEGSDPTVAPLRRALAVWGLDADDIGVVSIHGTGTVANERNETRIWNDILETIGRTPGNALPVMAQKSLIGHSKGGSAAWQLIALWQSINSGVIPGNRNADNIDADFRQWEHLMFPSKSIHTDGIRCGVMSSFGFGQVGGTALIIHPRYLFGSLHPNVFNEYKKRNRVRYLSTYKAMSEMMINNSLVKIQAGPPYSSELEIPVLLNPLARATAHSNGGYAFPSQLPSSVSQNLPNLATFTEAMRSKEATGIGIDHELITSVPSHNQQFLRRNYTANEINHCQEQPDPAASFAARWAAKEAVFKSMGARSRGSGAPMNEIEILTTVDGGPRVELHGQAKEVAHSKGITHIHVSLSHSEGTAIAIAQAISHK